MNFAIWFAFAFTIWFAYFVLVPPLGAILGGYF